MQNDKRSSADWQKLCTVTVLDPDGWRNNNVDWDNDLITREEFENMIGSSTCKFTNPIVDKNGNVNEIWKDKIEEKKYGKGENTKR